MSDEPKIRLTPDVPGRSPGVGAYIVQQRDLGRGRTLHEVVGLDGRVIHSYEGDAFADMGARLLARQLCDAFEVGREIEARDAEARGARRMREAAADEAERFLILIGAGWQRFPHNSSDGKARESMCVARIRALPDDAGKEAT